MYKRNFIIVVSLLVLINLIDLNMFFHHYGKKFTDSDQLIFWLQSQDISKGIFHSIFLYGQDYNIPYESFLAAPLLGAGVSPESALVLVNLVSIFSVFLLFAYLAYRKGSDLGVLLAVTLPLLLPVEWLILTSSARGFIGGIVVASFGMILHATSSNSLLRTSSLVLCFVGFTINPNAVVLLLPYFIWLLLTKDIRWREVLYAIPFILIWYLVLQSEKNQMPVVTHPSWNIAWEWSAFTHSMSHFNDMFKGVLPVFYELGALWPLYLLLVIYGAFKKNKAALKITAILFLVFLFLSLGINKVADGTSSIYFPYARMFIAFPFVLIWFILQLYTSQDTSKTVLFSVLTSGILGFGVKQIFFNERTDRALKTSSGVVQVRYVPQLKEQCIKIDSIANAKTKKLVLFHYKADELTYGCKVYCNTATLHPNYERRYWLMNRYQDTKAKDILFFDWTDKIQEEVTSITLNKLDDIGEPIYLSQDSLSLKEIYPEEFTFAK